MNSAGSSVTTSCLSAICLGEAPAADEPVSMRSNPVSALLPCLLSSRAQAGSSTRRSLSASGGMRCGFQVARRMT